MALTRVVLLAAFLFAASSVSAATTIDLGPSDYRRWGSGTSHHSLDGLRHSFGQTVRMPPANTNMTVTRNPVVPYGSIGNALKTIGRGTPHAILASAAMSGLFYAMDWVFDQSDGQWKRMGDPSLYEHDDLSLWYGTYSSYETTGPTADIVCQRVVSQEPSYTYTHFISSSANTAYCYGNTSSANGLILATISKLSTPCPSGSYYDENLGGCIIDGEFELLTDSDFDNLTDQLPSLPSVQVGDAAGDAQRQLGNPLPGYSDLDITGPASSQGPSTSTSSSDATGTHTSTTTTTYNYNYGPTTITTTTTTTTNNYTNGSPTGSTTTTTTPGEQTTSTGGGGGASDWPEFCTWAKVVCDFIDWFKTPFDASEVEWPLIEDQDFEEEFEFNLPSQCPEPYTINLQLFPPVTFSWQPFCDLASMIRPLVLASAAIFAAFITLGIARART